MLLDKLRPSFLNGSLTVSDAIALTLRVARAADVDSAGDAAEYQRTVGNFLGVPHVFAFGAARMALYVLLKALDLKPGAEVILPGYTCVVMPNAIRFAGGTPRYADIRLTDLNLDPQSVESAITPRTRAVLMQHTFGIPADIPAIRDLCRRRGLFLIEDGAHALGAVFDGKPVGHWGDVALFSTESSKMISTDLGGLLVTADATLAQKIGRIHEQLPIRSPAQERAAMQRVVFNVLTQAPLVDLACRALGRVTGRPVSDWSFFRRHRELHQAMYEAELNGIKSDGYPRRLAGALCRVGTLQIKRLEQDVRERNQKAAYVAGVLSRHGARLPSYDLTRCTPSFVKYPFLVDDRERWINALGQLGLPWSTWLNDPLHPAETRCHAVNNYHWGSCPNGEYAARHVLNLPLGRTATMSILQRLERLKL